MGLVTSQPRPTDAGLACTCGHRVLPELHGDLAGSLGHGTVGVPRDLAGPANLN